MDVTVVRIVYFLSFCDNTTHMTLIVQIAIDVVDRHTKHSSDMSGYGRGSGGGGVSGGSDQ
jgi:hypothetical protein